MVFQLMRESVAGVLGRCSGSFSCQCPEEISMVISYLYRIIKITGVNFIQKDKPYLRTLIGTLVGAWYFEPRSNLKIAYLTGECFFYIY